MAKRTSKKQREEQQFVEAFLVGAVENGLIDPAGLSEAELHNAFAEYLLETAQSSEPLYGFVDHSQDLLKRARQELKKENYHFAALFYATWVEHWTNWHIHCLAVRSKRLSENQITEMTREVPLRGKLSWLIHALGGNSIAKLHRNAVQRLSDHRNAFIHYKYPSFDSDEYVSVAPELKKAVDSFEKTIQYLQNHDRIVIKRGIHMKIKRYVQEVSQ